MYLEKRLKASVAVKREEEEEEEEEGEEEEPEEELSDNEDDDQPKARMMDVGKLAHALHYTLGWTNINRLKEMARNELDLRLTRRSYAERAAELKQLVESHTLETDDEL